MRGKSAELVLESKFWIGAAVVPFNEKRLSLAEAGFGLSQSYSRNPAEQGSNQAKGFRFFSKYQRYASNISTVFPEDILSIEPLSVFYYIQNDLSIQGSQFSFKVDGIIMSDSYG